MKNKIVILGSTVSIGSSTLSVIKKNKFKVVLLSTNKNIRKIFKQAIKYKVKDIIIEDKKKFIKYKNLFLKNNIRPHFGHKNFKSILKMKSTYCVNAISGLKGLSPTLDIIPLTKNILIANKESIICGWSLIKKKLIKYKTNFIPLDSEHYSIWKLIKNENYSDISKIVLTASGGPFLRKKSHNLANIKPKFALRHPNWKMGKKFQ